MSEKCITNKSAIIAFVSMLFIFLFLVSVPKSYAGENLTFDKESYSIEAGDYEYIYIESGEADPSTWVSSDESVVRIIDTSSYQVYVEAVGVGDCTISVQDAEGNAASVGVTVNKPEWTLEKDTIEDGIENDGRDIYVNSDYYEFDFTAVSSDEDVVTAVADSSYVYLTYEGVGTATVTVTDQFGQSAVINVTVKPAPFEFDEDIQTEYSEYEGEDCINIYSKYDDSDIVSVTSSDTKVIKAKVVNEDGFSFIEATPVGAGTATITARDQYGQTAETTISFTQKYIDEMKYQYILEDTYLDAYFGDTAVYFTGYYADFKGAVITATIGGKEYTAVYNGYVDGAYEYVIKNLSPLKVGTEISYTIRKGEAVHSGEAEVTYGPIDDRSYLELSGYTYTYSGKRISPATEVDYWFNYWEDYKYLKRGTDYNVVYMNNLDVGKATAKVTGIGNYRGVLSETYTILPKGTSITKVSKAKKAFTVKWKKQATKMSKTPISGYQIRYSLKSGMSGAKTKTVKGYAKTSLKVKKLKSKKKYYVQIRTYQTVNGNNYYSAWSGKKKVKTK